MECGARAKESDTDTLSVPSTEGINIYCNTVYFTHPAVSQLFCDHVRQDAPLIAATTYLGQTDRSLGEITTYLEVLNTQLVVLDATTMSSVEHSSMTAAAGVGDGHGDGGRESRRRRVLVGAIVGALLTLLLLMVSAVVIFKRAKSKIVVEEIGGPGKGDG